MRLRFKETLAAGSILFSLFLCSTAFATITLPWSTTFNCSDLTCTSPLPAFNCDGITEAGPLASCGGNWTQITSAANNPGGGGGKGTRIWMGDGKNVNTAGFRVVFSKREPELWLRWYMRYQQGFQWSGGQPYGEKLFYIATGSQGVDALPMWMYGKFSVTAQPNGLYQGSGGSWSSVMGGSGSDGKWHCYEVHIKMDTNGSNGIAEGWIDNVQVFRNTSANFGTKGGWISTLIKSNEDSPANGGCRYVDWDDIVISNAGRVGPINQGATDTTPPNVSIATPTAGQTVSGTATITSNASDNIGVSGVQYRLNGANLGTERSSAPYSLPWNTTTAANGNHVLTAVARDTAGNTKTSSGVTVNVSNGQAGTDTTKPTVSITSLRSGVTLRGAGTVTATASDNIGVIGVQYKLDGINLGPEDVTAPYTVYWDTSTTSNGSHTLTAVARDAAGNTATSSPITVTIQNQVQTGGDTVKPTVSISSLRSGTTVAKTGTVTATASDNIGVIGVQFKLDGVNLGTEDTSSPYTVTWDTTKTSNGTHTLTAVARDAAGNSATSSGITVTVANQTQTDPGTPPPQTGNILFQENFEDSNMAARGWYDHVNLTISKAEHVSGSTGSAQFDWATGARASTPGGSMRKKFTATDSLYVSYFVKYSSNFTGSNKSYHPHEFYILTNKNGDWDGLAYDYLNTYIEQNEGVPQVIIQDSANIDTSRINQDLTNSTENRAVAGCNGNSNSGGAAACYSSGSNYYNGYTWKAPGVYFSDSQGAFYKNNWHLVEVYLKLNSVVNGKGQRDGVIQYWYDGNMIINLNNVMFRTGENPDMKFNQLVIAPYIGDGSPVNQSFWVDDLVLATGRVADYENRLSRK